ncbi:lactonase family protein [Leifsonia poae]|uniref:lactonase family protein n=1 Tax=Leifsonia poae TaxID=110933 RepID=UPI003D67485A
MRTTARLALAGVAALAATALFASPALASPPQQSAAPVFVQTDALSGNSVVALDRAADGSLHTAGTYATGGLGGALTGSVVDHLASQGSLTYDRGLLYAVNAGSNTVTVFAVRGDHLIRRQVVASGGNFPVSVTAHGNLVYVLNARSGGVVQGYVRAGDFLIRIPAWNRSLGLNAAQTPEFTSTPGQVAFTPSGSQLVVTTKGNGSSIDVFAVNRFGGLSAQPVKNVEPGAVPFAVTFDAGRHLVVAEAGTNAVGTFTVNANGTLTPIAQLATAQAATCWIAGTGSTFYASNAGSASLTGARDPGDGSLAAIGNTATDPGTVDGSVTSDGHFLYVQTGANGIVDGFRINANGSLTPVGSVTVPGAVGGEGIAAL